MVLHRSIIELCQADHRAERALIEQWLANKTRENLSTWFTASELEGKVAVFEGSIVGVGLLHCEGEILLCYVLPEVVHQGVGKALLNSMIESGKRLGVQNFFLESTAVARAFYERNGFVSSGPPTSWCGLLGYPMEKSVK